MGLSAEVVSRDIENGPVASLGTQVTDIWEESRENRFGNCAGIGGTRARIERDADVVEDLDKVLAVLLGGEEIAKAQPLFLAKTTQKNYEPSDATRMKVKFVNGSGG